MVNADNVLSPEAAERLKTAALKAFTPRTPISNKELFAGRWDQLSTIRDIASEVGLHAVIFGERGVGKTSLTHVIKPTMEVLDSLENESGETKPRIIIRVNSNGTDTFASLWAKALDEIFWIQNKPSIGLQPAPQEERITLRKAFAIGDEIDIDTVRRCLMNLPGSVFIFDEFDRLLKRPATAFTDLIKALSDGAIDTTVVLVGVAETVDGLMKDHASVGRALIQIRMPRMDERELGEILANATKVLNVTFEESARRKIVKMSQGLPHFTHLIGLHAVRSAAARLSSLIQGADVQEAFTEAVAQADQTVASAYTCATHSAQPGAKYPQVILAAAVAAYMSADDFGYFQPAHLVSPMTVIMGRREEIAGFNQHLSQFMEPKRGSVLERSGGPRAYRFRFTYPLMPPYILMRSIRDKIVTTEQVETMLAE